MIVVIERDLGNSQFSVLTTPLSATQGMENLDNVENCGNHVAIMDCHDKEVPKISRSQIFAYAAPVLGSYFFYIPMWSILPGIYSKYFGLPLSSVAGIVLFMRVFDGVTDLTVGYSSDRLRAAGGSRKSWVIVGGLGAIVTCYFLFIPQQKVTGGYYLIWSLAYFLAFAVAEIPHLSWGSELTLDYHLRARVFAARNIFSKLAESIFYALPLLPMVSSSDYTPEVLRLAVLVGGLTTSAGLIWTMMRAPSGLTVKPMEGHDGLSLLLTSIVKNKPLLLFLAADICGALCAGMWYGLLYIYFDTYLNMGSKLAVMLLLSTGISTLSTPLWLKLISKTSKSTAWATGIGLFLFQLLSTALLRPGDNWLLGFAVILLANLYLTANDVAAVSAVGDIVDYGKLKFRVDRGATYFATLNLIGKIGLGLGGAIALGVAGHFGFNATDKVHSESAIFGLKIGFIVLPAVFAIFYLLMVVRTPITPRRHRIIQRRIEAHLH